ncbi:hypothetical protein VTJ04DRAFT_267 [Mycothermus thermophilus]|uniref:uncharacterized protein n=1 Tax=Humicola insolens TaxID=85995 RepID=UPI0037447AAF
MGAPIWEAPVNQVEEEKAGNNSSLPQHVLSALRSWKHTMPHKQSLHLSTATVHAEPPTHGRYSVAAGTLETLRKLTDTCRDELPESVLPFTKTVQVTSSSGEGDQLCFPVPFKEQEAVGAIRALEAAAAAAIAEHRYGTKSRRIEIDIDKISASLMSAYVTTLDGMDKSDPRIRTRIPDTDLNRAQSVLYRRMSAGLYATKNPGEYYHIHGSLDADVTLGMLGLPKDVPELTDYREIIKVIESAVQQHTPAELETLNAKHRQAGVRALTYGQFRATPHGQAITSLPPLTVRPNPGDDLTPPALWPPPLPSHGPRYALAGIKVLELCRVIAGPTIGRSLAAHGAQVIKVTCPSLPDVPFFQLEVNTGKHAIHLNLRPTPPGEPETQDRKTFAALLADADVLIDGYRPGALARLGYSSDLLAELARRRGKGYVYVAEDCFGGTGLGLPTAEWASRPGWQQIADCVTGVAWEQGRFMGLDEPVVPPFPMSDYGTGALGSAAALAGLLRRAQVGGSWVCRTSLVQYDVFLMQLGLVPEGERERLRALHDNEAGFFGLRHSDSVDEVGKRALGSMRLVAPWLFSSPSSSSSSPTSTLSSSTSLLPTCSANQQTPGPAPALAASRLMQEAYSAGFNGVLRWPREAARIDGLRVGHVRTSRPNGWDTNRLLLAQGPAGTTTTSSWDEEEWEEDIVPELEEGEGI